MVRSGMSTLPIAAIEKVLHVGVRTWVSVATSLPDALIPVHHARRITKGDGVHQAFSIDTYNMQVPHM